MLQTFRHLQESGYGVQHYGAVPLPEFILGSGEGNITGRSTVAENCSGNKYFIVLRIMSSSIVRFAL
jgi:hypothetical protein